MKCKSCKIAVSPKFVAAITNNVCPACGSQMMTSNHYEKIFSVAKQLGGLGFDDDLLVGVAAAISSKFTLVPASLTLEEGFEDSDDEPEPTIPVRKVRQNPIRQKRQNREINVDFDEEDDIVSEAEREQIIREFGMDVGSGTVLDPEPRSSKKMDLDVGIFDDGEEIEALVGSPMAAKSSKRRHSDLLAKAAAMKLNPGRPTFRRFGTGEAIEGRDEY